MRKFKYFEYYLDEAQAINSGKFILYRNEAYQMPNGAVIYEYSPYLTPQDPSSVSVFKSTPVALGITAFLVKGLPNLNCIFFNLLNNIHFTTEEHYAIYLKNTSKWAFIENDRCPKPKSFDEVNYLFLKKHLSAEKKHLKDSISFYTDPRISLENKIIIDLLRKYALGYIDWISNKLNMSMVNKPQLHTIHKSNKSKLITSTHPDKPIMASELSPLEFITAIEQILSFTYICFHDQTFPNQRINTKFLTKANSLRDIEYYYQIHIDPEFFNHSRFMTIVRTLLIDKNVKTEEFRIILKKCFNASKANQELYNKHLASKKFEDFHTIFMEFGCTSGKITYYLDPSKDTNFELYLNHNLVHFSTIVYNFLKSEIFIDNIDKTITTFTKNNDLEKFTIKEQSDLPTTLKNRPALQEQTARIFISDKIKNTDFLSNYFEGSDSQFIEAIDSILSTINNLFLDQAFPESRSEFFRILGSEIGQSVSYHYIIDNGNQIFDFSAFKNKIRSLLIRSDVDKSGLKKILKNSYAHATSNAILFSDHINLKQFASSKNLFLKFDIDKLCFIFSNSKSYPVNIVSFTNLKLAEYSASVAELLQDEVGFEKINSNNVDDFNTKNYPPEIKSLAPQENKESYKQNNAVNGLTTIPEIFSYLEHIEALLSFINLMFTIQVNPDTQYPTSAELKLYEVKNTHFNYFIEDLDNLLDFRLFRSRIRVLASDKGRDIQQLRTSFQHAYSLAENIIQLFDYNLTSISPGKIITVRAYINNIPVEFGLEQDFLYEKFIQLNNYELLLISRYIHAVLGFEIYQVPKPSINIHSVPIFLQPVIKERLSNSKNDTDLKSVAQTHNPFIPKKKVKTKPQTLSEIWLGSENEYLNILNNLCQVYLDIDKPFLFKNNDQYTWNDSIKGSFQYLKGFVYICINNNWILDKYSAKTYQIIFTNSFNTNPHHDIYKSLSTNPPDDIYLKPFLSYPKR